MVSSSFFTKINAIQFLCYNPDLNLFDYFRLKCIKRCQTFLTLFWKFLWHLLWLSLNSGFIKKLKPRILLLPMMLKFCLWFWSLWSKHVVRKLSLSFSLMKLPIWNQYVKCFTLWAQMSSTFLTSWLYGCQLSWWCPSTCQLLTLKRIKIVKRWWSALSTLAVIIWQRAANLFKRLS